MKFSSLLNIIFFVGSSNAVAKINSQEVTFKTPALSSAISENKLIEELTGKKIVTTQSSADLKKAPLPVQHYFAGQRALKAKNYILAIKHFNTVIQKYPQSNQVSSALIAKARVYKEMGLQPQADRNLKLAQLKKRPTSGLAGLPSKGKLIR